ncbi:PEP-CTERM sorting domain-containing protein [Rubritalea tangerina]
MSAAFFLFGGMGQAAIVAYSNDFSNPLAVSDYSSVGAVAPTYYHTTSNRDGLGGDGVAGDGAMYFNVQNNTSGDEVVAYAFQGTMDEGEAYRLTMGSFNVTNNYNGYYMSLYNATDGVELVRADLWQPAGYPAARTDVLEYTALASDAGDVLEFRVGDKITASFRDFAVDNVSLEVTAVPEPSVSGMLICALGAIVLRRRR